jgi:general secretion pathway protein I
MRPASEGGFTLLEVMVALAILAASLVAISEVVGGALRNHVRARQLDMATLLARGKMVEVQADLELKGFKDFDESEDGNFEAEGHPEVRWKLEVRRPTVELGPEGVFRALSGKSVDELLPPPDEAPQLAALRGGMMAMFQPVLTRIGEQIKTTVREVRLTVSWEDGGKVESFDVTTHLVVPQGGEK